MHSPVATLKRVPSAQVCRNACKDNLINIVGRQGNRPSTAPTGYILKESTFPIFQWTLTLLSLVQTYILSHPCYIRLWRVIFLPCPRLCRHSTCCTRQDAHRHPSIFHCSQSPAKNEGSGNHLWDETRKLKLEIWQIKTPPKFRFVH